MLFTFSNMIKWLLNYRYFILFPLVVIEGPIVTIISGSLSAAGLLNFFLSYVIIVIADLVGDSIYYFFGRWGGQNFIKKWGHLIGLNSDRVIDIKNYFNSYGGRILIMGKISHGIGGIFLVAAGLAKMPFTKYFWFNFIATLVKSMALLLIGYYFGEALTKVKSLLGFLTAISVSLVIVAIGVYLYHCNRKQRAKYINKNLPTIES